MKVGVIGGGSWGTALGAYAAQQGLDVLLWAYEKEVVDQINNEHRNDIFLPDNTFPPLLRATNRLSELADGVDLILSVVPTQHLRPVLSELKPHLKNGISIVSASKGIENNTLLTPVSIFREIFGTDNPDNHFGVLAGPSFAKEVVKGMPTTVVCATLDTRFARFVQNSLSSESMRIYTSDDVIGVEICGAVKNVLALASGTVAGLGLGSNTQAAVITRGTAEIKRLVLALGGLSETVSGLAGIGDIVLTCTSSTSRNYTVGHRIGSGESLDDIVKSMRMIAEGVKTTLSVEELSNNLGVDMPISHAMYNILYDGLHPMDAVINLMTRELKPE